MTGKITYSPDGTRRYFLNGHEVTEEGYNFAIPSRLADMLESGIAPYGVTDATFMAGKHDQFANQQAQGDRYAERAREHGMTSVKGKRYMSQLARFPGDPEAWVRGRGDVQRVCEQRGWGCEGAVKVAPVEKEKAPATAIADDILESRANREIAETVAVTGAPPKEKKQTIKERIKERIKPHWSK